MQHLCQLPWGSVTPARVPRAVPTGRGYRGPPAWGEQRLGWGCIQGGEGGSKCLKRREVVSWEQTVGGTPVLPLPQPGPCCCPPNTPKPPSRQSGWSVLTPPRPAPAARGQIPAAPSCRAALPPAQQRWAVQSSMHAGAKGPGRCGHWPTPSSPKRARVDVVSRREAAWAVPAGTLALRTLARGRNAGAMIATLPRVPRASCSSHRTLALQRRALASTSCRQACFSPSALWHCSRRGEAQHPQQGGLEQGTGAETTIPASPTCRALPSSCFSHSPPSTNLHASFFCCRTAKTRTGTGTGTGLGVGYGQCSTGRRGIPLSSMGAASKARHLMQHCVQRGVGSPQTELHSGWPCKH